MTVPDFTTLRLEVRGAVAVLTLNRPEAGNAFVPEMVEELPHALAWLADRAPARALVLTGAGRLFSAGGDVEHFRGGLENPAEFAESMRHGLGRLHHAIAELCRIPYPVIAALNGHAIGAGLALALACDLRVASSRAKLMFAYGRLGASPDAGMSYFLPRLVGTGRAMRLLLEEPMLRAPEALEIGLVNEVVAPEEVLSVSIARAQRLAAKPPGFLRNVKRLVHAGHGLLDQLELERHTLADATATPDFAAGVTALFAGERPVFARGGNQSRG
jgi:2-(1,2-epoxy-1,2-dihydrophenyl)acetyl-CoA isomerase